MSDIITDSIKKPAVYAIFGKYYGNKLIKLIDDCCNDFCKLVFTCIGIDITDGDEDLFLNQRGQWVEAASLEPIEVTNAQMLSLISNSTVEDANYLITDVEEGIFIQGFAPNIVSPHGTMQAYLPAYIESGVYKGQYHAELGAIANGEIYTWGNINYKNESGGSLTPDTPSANVLDSTNRFVELAKSAVNFYELKSLAVTLDDSLNLVTIEQVEKQNIIAYNFIVNASGVETAEAALAQLNLNSPFGTFAGQNRFIILTNNRVEDNTAGIINNKGSEFSTMRIRDCFFKDYSGLGNSIGCSNNDLFSSGNIINIVGEIRVGNNKINAGGCEISNMKSVNGGYLDILNCELHDNCQIDGWEFTGTGGEVQFWDNHLHENHQFTNFDFQLTTGTLEFSNGHYNHSCTLDTFVFTTAGQVQFNFAQNFDFSNATDVFFTNSEFCFEKYNLKTIDFTGFSKTIASETVVGNQGLFCVSYDFTVNPLSSPNSLLFNLIPTGARITEIKAIGDGLSGGVGATLTIGLQTDDESLVTGNLAAINSVATYTTASVAATTNRSLKVTAGVANVTGGTIRIQVSFVL